MVVVKQRVRANKPMTLHATPHCSHKSNVVLVKHQQDFICNFSKMSWVTKFSSPKYVKRNKECTFLNQLWSVFCQCYTEQKKHLFIALLPMQLAPLNCEEQSLYLIFFFSIVFWSLKLAFWNVHHNKKITLNSSVS